MGSNIDIVIEASHPQLEAVRAAARQLNTTLTTCSVSGWNEAVAVGNADWTICVDGRAALLPNDISLFAELIQHAVTPVCLLPGSEAGSNNSSLWQNCSPTIAVCWNNPAQYSAICLQRSQRQSLPPFDAGQPEMLWEWLTRAVSRPATISWIGNSGRPASGEIESEGSRLPRLAPSGPAREDVWLIEHISRLKPSQLVPEKTSEADSVAVKAGLLQWHDALDASHQLAQSIEGLGARQSGDYWHAIMHRREPDYSNAKYWFRQLGAHAVFEELAGRATEILDRTPDASTWKSRLFARKPWDPLAFVDFCESCAGREETPLGFAARQIQAVEMQLLLIATYGDASGKKSS